MEKLEGQKNLDKLINITSKLYKTKSKSSPAFTETILNSKELKNVFGISARKSTHAGIPDDDLPIGFFDGKYYIIPNSATLRRDSPLGQENTLLSWNSPEDEVNKILKRFFNDAVEYLKEEFNFIAENHFQSIS